MTNFIKEEGGDILTIYRRLKNRNFEGNTGLAVKNSTYQFVTLFITKIGSLLFTIILARMLLPELFGLYSLALSTILFFGIFSDFGIGSALITFVSKSLARKDFGKAKAYFKILLKFKFLLVSITFLILALSAYPVAKFYYNKPIFIALLAGAIYLFIINILGFIGQSFITMNNFKHPLIKEVIFQILRLILVPLSILIFLKYSLSSEVIVAGIILVLSFCYFIGLVFLLRYSKEELPFLNYKEKKITKVEKDNLKRFVLPLIATSLSGTFLGYIDMIMLGQFVKELFIGYYNAAFTLIASVTAIISFTSVSLFPIFSGLKGQALERGFNKSLRLILLVSIVCCILTFLLAPLGIKLVYGEAYEPSIAILRLLSLLLVSFPLSSLYFTYFISQEKTKILSKLLIGTIILNIILNYIFIIQGLKFGMMGAIIGVGISTIISKNLYLWGLVFWRKR